jgi:L,D-transpeptidase catalytic domain
MIRHLCFSVKMPCSLYSAAFCIGLLSASPGRAQIPPDHPPAVAPAERGAPDQSPVPPQTAMPADPSRASAQDPAPMQAGRDLPAPEAAAPGAGIQYHLERPHPLNRFRPRQMSLIQKLNRVDRRDLGNLREIVVPDRWDLPTNAYSPMPQFVPGMAAAPKAVIVDLPGQVFGAYENGRLIRWGPVNTGKRGTPTPPGIYHLNWKSPLRISSVNSSWKMPYYFNFSARFGLGMHEYQMPGGPASHGCVRMLTADAQWLFDWGQQRSRAAKGTPVVIVGQYHFGDPKPWLQPGWLAHGVQLPPNLMNEGLS